MLDIEKAKNDFDDFIFGMDDQIEAIEALAEERQINISIAMDSLENLEELFFQLSKHASNTEKDSLIISFARYVGEIVRINFKGKWHLSLEDSKNVYYNTPVIIDHTSTEGLEFSPIFAVRALSLRKKRGLLRQIIMADIDPQDIDIDHLEEK